MSDAYVIEIAGEDIGLVVRQPGERVYRFHAASRSADALDGRLFANPRAAERAATLHLTGAEAALPRAA